jgi:carbohydrate kinase (thermoresistant glucokinase family)
MNNLQPQIYIIMGVSGSGKTTIGQSLAQALNIDFYDGDDFHPQENIDKMHQGIPLNDEDRMGWLHRIHQKCYDACYGKNGEKVRSIVFACSALKNIYRQILSENLRNYVTFIHLKGDMLLITTRLQHRQQTEQHFMPLSLLQSQFQILEEPKQTDSSMNLNQVIEVSIDQSIDEIVKNILSQLTSDHSTC